MRAVAALSKRVLPRARSQGMPFAPGKLDRHFFSAVPSHDQSPAFEEAPGKFVLLQRGHYVVKCRGRTYVVRADEFPDYLLPLD